MCLHIYIYMRKVYTQRDTHPSFIYTCPTYRVYCRRQDLPVDQGSSTYSTETKSVGEFSSILQTPIWSKNYIIYLLTIRSLGLLLYNIHYNIIGIHNNNSYRYLQCVTRRFTHLLYLPTSCVEKYLPFSIFLFL